MQQYQQQLMGEYTLEDLSRKQQEELANNKAEIKNKEQFDKEQAKARKKVASVSGVIARQRNTVVKSQRNKEGLLKVLVSTATDCGLNQAGLAAIQNIISSQPDALLGLIKALQDIKVEDKKIQQTQVAIKAKQRELKRLKLLAEQEYSTSVSAKQVESEATSVANPQTAQQLAQASGYNLADLNLSAGGDPSVWEKLYLRKKPDDDADAAAVLAFAATVCLVMPDITADFKEVFEQLDTAPPPPPSYDDEMMFLEFKPFKEVFEDTAPAPAYVAANAEDIINKFAWTSSVLEPEPQGQQEDSARTFVSTETMFDRKRDANKRSEAVDTSAEPEPEPQGQQDSLGGQSAQLRRSPRLVELAEKRQPIKATGSSSLSEQVADVPPYLMCGITLGLVVDPVNGNDGKLYSHATLERWVSENGEDPSHNKMALEDIAPNRPIAELLEHYHSNTADLALQRFQQELARIPQPQDEAAQHRLSRAAQR
jgi:hypothetical protein